ncbi:hypothetical protein N7488_010250 [Penicillium malachiteum]|nr:hypothetical protein N7488_010250 [Penicillium malachiteum]
MRSALLLAALAATCANAFEKRVYVTDWTTVTVTTTVTAPTVTETLPPMEKAQVESSDTELFKKSTVLPDPETTSTTTAHKHHHKETSTSVADAVTSTVEPAAPTTMATSTSSSSSSTSSTSTTTSSSATTSATSAYQQKILYNHNIHRSNHSVSSLEWSADLESSAYTLAARCDYEHDTSIDGGGYGQNIGYGVESSEIGVMITNLMYNDEIEYYPGYGSNPSMTNFDKWGHFSQIVWKATTHVGCATVTCDPLDGVDSSEALPFTVCNYSPVGNVEGEYADNVLHPDGGATYVA